MICGQSGRVGIKSLNNLVKIRVGLISTYFTKIEFFFNESIVNKGKS